MQIGDIMHAIHSIDFQSIENPTPEMQKEIKLYSKLLELPSKNLKINNTGDIFYIVPPAFAVCGFKDVMVVPNETAKTVIFHFKKRIEHFQHLYDTRQFMELYSLMDVKELLMSISFIMENEHLTFEEKGNLWIETYSHLDYNHDRLFPYLNPSFIKDNQVELIESLEGDYVQIYRGMTDKSTPVKAALSWTTDIRTACFFANRYESKEHILAYGRIHKNDVYYYTNSSEKELLVNPEKVIIDRIVRIGGTEVLTKDFTEIKLSFRFSYSNFYATGTRYIDSNLFENPYGVHGVMHTKRVLFHTLIQCMVHERSWDETIILMMAAVYHDIGRIHDEYCEEHGRYSIQKLQDKKIDRLIGFTDNEQYYKLFDMLVEYHCKPDEFGYKFIEQSDIEDKKQAIELLNIFKDADGLDRVRLGDLDIMQLRNPESYMMQRFAENVYRFIE